MSKFENYRSGFETFRRDLPFHVLFEKVIYIWVGLPDFKEGHLFGLKMENTSFFQGFQREYVQMVPKWLEGP